MFNINVTDGMLQAWKELGDPLATAADIAFIESSLGIKRTAWRGGVAHTGGASMRDNQLF